MTYALDGHGLRHAVEEMLIQLFPSEPLSIGEPEGTGNYCVSSLSEENGIARAVSEVRINGVTEKRTESAPVPFFDGLERKRIETGLVKTSIYKSVLPFLPCAPAWGSLTGVRPAKLARGLMERGMGRGEAARYLREHYYVSPERAALTVRSAVTAMELDKGIAPEDVSLYVGIPFCPSRCYYCSFVSAETERSKHLLEPYLEVLSNEVQETGKLIKEAGRKVTSIYIGGGTPTTLSPEQLKHLLSNIEESFDLSGLKEYTVEAGRPDTITVPKLDTMRGFGVSRISINPQSMEDNVLEAIGRRHSALDVLRAYAEAREAGFEKINMDVIAGLEGDTEAGFAETLEKLINLKPENITVHNLAVKRGAKLVDKERTAAARGTVAGMLAKASKMLGAGGYGPYYLYRQKYSAGGLENVGWCVPETECFYNVVMMEELETIISLGAGGVSKLIDRPKGSLKRANNPKYPLEYIRAKERITELKRKLLDITQGE